MKHLFLSITAIASLYLAFCTALYAQNGLEFDKTVHDFGQVLMSNGPVSCTFEAVNTSNSDITIMSVTTSCGCTDVKWDHNAIKPGAKAKVSATYSNDEGPYPFDKTLTVKIAGQNKPIILHLRGISQERIKADSEIYTEVFGNALGLETAEFKCGNLEQGGSRREQFTVANLGKTPLNLSFASVSPGMKVEVKPNPIPAGEHATVSCTVSAQADVWGYNYYYATPVINGKNSGKSFRLRAFTADNFSSLSKEEKKLGSRPVFDESTFSFGHKKQGAKFQANFSCVNQGKKELVIYKVDVDYASAVAGEFPKIAAGKSGKFSVQVDTKDLPKGEALIMVTLTTNSPVRPIVTLFIAGIID